MDGKQDFAGLGTGVKEIRAASADFIKYVEELKVELIDGVRQPEWRARRGRYAVSRYA